MAVNAGRFARPKEIWSLLTTDIRKEQKAQDHLENKGFEVYLPLDHEGPLFPGYLFCRVEDKDTEVIRSSLIMHLVHFGTQPAIVPNRVIEDLKSTEWLRSDSLPEGSEIRLNDLAGQYRHMKAIIKAKKHDRILVLLSMMGREAELEVDAKAVEI